MQAILFALLALVGLIRSQEGVGLPIQYAVVMDAGSSGTRAYVYMWELPRNLELPTITELGNKKISPGLSATDPTQVATYLQPLVDYAAGLVPTLLQSKTPIFLKATAGMRLLPLTEQNSRLDAVRALFSTSPFWSRPDWVKVISGAEEGVLGWVAVNYLLGNLETTDPPSATVGALDLGGASTQITFDTTISLAANDVPISVNDLYYDLYAYSYLGYGNDQARMAYQNWFATMTTSTMDPCLYQDFSYNTNTGTPRTVQGSGDGNTCMSLITTSVLQLGTDFQGNLALLGNYQPSVNGISFNAFSAFDYVAQKAIALGIAPGPTFTLAQLQSTAVIGCAMGSGFGLPLTSVQATECFLYSYAAVLVESYGISEVTIPQQIAGKSVTWAFGSILRDASLIDFQIGPQNEDLPLTTTQILVVDAGSSGSRIFLYQYDFDATVAIPTIVQAVDAVGNQVSKQIKPGIATFTDMTGVTGVVNGLLGYVRPYVKNPAKTQVFFYATAGMRLLYNSDPMTANLILSTVQSAIIANGFAFGDSAIISGIKEGAFAWIATNYLLDNLPLQAGEPLGSEPPPTGVLDMGGASTQIIFSPDSAPLHNDIILRVANKDYSLYDYSYLGWGNDQARIAKNNALVEAAATTDPCLNTGYTQTYTSTVTGKKTTVQGSGNADSCYDLIVSLMNLPSPRSDTQSIQGNYQPDIFPTTKLYAVNGYVFGAAAAGLSGTQTIPALLTAAETYCARPSSSLPTTDSFASTNCFLATFGVALLRGAYQIPDTTPITLVSTINNVAASWSLGAIIFQSIAQQNQFLRTSFITPLDDDFIASLIDNGSTNRVTGFTILFGSDPWAKASTFVNAITFPVNIIEMQFTFPSAAPSFDNTVLLRLSLLLQIEIRKRCVAAIGDGNTNLCLSLVVTYVTALPSAKREPTTTSLDFQVTSDNFINECSLFDPLDALAADGFPHYTCVDHLYSRTVTCDPGYYAISTGSSKPVTLVATLFTGCAVCTAIPMNCITVASCTNTKATCGKCAPSYFLDPTTKSCTLCGNGGATYACGLGTLMTGTPCDGTTSVDTQTCPPCSNGGTVYKCPTGNHMVGTVCPGTGIVDTQACLSCGVYACPDTQYQSGSVCDGTSATNSQTCTTCGNTIGTVYQCPPGQYKTGTTCKDTASDTQSCQTCGGTYTCAPGSFMTGAACDGTTFSNTQTCQVCSNGGATFSCPAGFYKPGTACAGTGTSDTQICSACRTVSCGRGTLTVGSCGPTTTSDTVACKTCQNGVDYVCPAGTYKTGTNCLGGVGTDTQTCSPCANGGANYACPAGTYISGSYCLGDGFTDTQKCTPCSNGGANWSCLPGYYMVGSACTGFGNGDSQGCSLCSGGAAYNCGSGRYRSGMMCNGQGTVDNQTCTRCSGGCPYGSYKSTDYVVCTGTGSSDTETCEVCGNGGSSYQCAEGYYPTGTPCDNSDSDTQTCEASVSCATYGCNYKGICTDTSVMGTRTCTCAGEQPVTLQDTDVYYGCPGNCPTLTDNGSQIQQQPSAFIHYLENYSTSWMNVSHVSVEDLTLTFTFQASSDLSTTSLSSDLQLALSKFFCIRRTDIEVTIAAAGKRTTNSYTATVVLTNEQVVTAPGSLVSVAAFLSFVMYLFWLL